MDMNTQHDAVTDVGLWAAMGGVCLFFFKKWGSKVNPFVLLRLAALWVNEPLMKKHVGPIIDEQRRQGAKLDRVCRVIDHMEGADKAHALVAEEDAERDRWEPIRDRKQA